MEEIREEPQAATMAAYGSSSSAPDGTGTMLFTLEELEIYTQGFSNQLNVKSAFGHVFLGTINNKHPDLDGRQIIVKRGENETHIKQQWNAEKRFLINNLRHRNIVILFGFVETSEYLYLVYPFEEKGDLTRYIADMPWDRVLQILIGTGRAMMELHNASIYHNDLKPQNILVDKDWEPILCDFGTAQNKDENCSGGTPGHTDPYLIKLATDGIENVKGTAATDVYSMGVLILSLVMRKLEVRAPNSKKYEDKFWMRRIIRGLKDMIHPSRREDPRRQFYNDEGIYHWAKDMRYVQKHAVHQGILASGCTIESAKQITDLALLCTSMHEGKRPSMAEVVDELLKMQGRGQPDRAGGFFHALLDLKTMFTG